MLLNRRVRHTLLDKIMEFPPGGGCSNSIRMGVDMVWMGDDVASQAGDDDFSRTVEKVSETALCQPVQGISRDANPEIKIAYHSCGNCGAIVGGDDRNRSGCASSCPAPGYRSD